MNDRPEVRDKSPPRDYRQEVTDDIIRMLEDGTAPWQKPWNAGDAGRTPYNPTTDKLYRGGNIVALLIASMRKGYTDPRWMTYRQAAEKGWQVRKGEKATCIEFWEAKPGSKEEDAEDDERRPRLIHRVYSVFNAQQVDGIPPIVIAPREMWQVCETGERMMRNSGADIRYGGNSAHFDRASDRIQLPPREAFADAPGFYGTSAHELGHWTGHPSRLNRETLVKSASFGDEMYAREELRAELASMMLAAETGIPHDPGQHGSYIASWIRALRHDKNEIFRAAADASKAVDYLLALDRAKNVTEPPVTHVDRVEQSRPKVVQLSF